MSPSGTRQGLAREPEPAMHMALPSRGLTMCGRPSGLPSAKGDGSDVTRPLKGTFLLGANMEGRAPVCPFDSPLIGVPGRRWDARKFICDHPEIWTSASHPQRTYRLDQPVLESLPPNVLMSRRADSRDGQTTVRTGMPPGSTTTEPGIKTFRYVRTISCAKIPNPSTTRR